MTRQQRLDMFAAQAMAAIIQLEKGDDAFPRLYDQNVRCDIANIAVAMALELIDAIKNSEEI